MNTNPDDILSNLSPEEKDRLLRELLARQTQQSNPITTGDENTITQAGRDVTQVGGDKIDGDKITVSNSTVQQFFGAQPPEDGEKLLAAYLDWLHDDCERLYLYRIEGSRKGGNEQTSEPHLRLQDVYTTLVTDGKPVVLRERQRTLGWVRRFAERLRLDECTNAQVAPLAVRTLVVQSEDGSPLPPDGNYELIQRARARSRELQAGMADVSDDMRVTYRIERPRLATEAIAARHRVVLLGEPGAGKSTVLRYLALLLAQRQQGNTMPLPGWEGVDPLPIPIFCPLGRVTSHMATHQTTALQALWDVLHNILEGSSGLRVGLRNHLKPALQRGAVLLLFDGLDELPLTEPESDSPRHLVAMALRELAAEVPHAPIAVTCRVLPYDGPGTWQLPPDWHISRLQPLTFGQVRQFVQSWYTALALPGGELSETEAEQRIADLNDQLHENPQVAPLVRSPLLLTMVAILHYNNDEVPRDRVKLYEKCVLLLLDRWEPVRTPNLKRPGLAERIGLPSMDLSELREVLNELAFKAHKQPPGDDGRGLLERHMLKGRFTEFFEGLCDNPSPHVRDLLRILREEAGLLYERSDAGYTFPHLTFQEYLAACYLAEQQELTELAYGCWQGSDGSRWRVVLELLAGCLYHQGKKAVERDGIPWLEVLMGVELGEKAKAPSQRWQDVLLAAVTYREMRPASVLKNSMLNWRDKLIPPLRAAIVDLLETPESGVVQDDRITAARVLADLGDPRFPVTIEQWQAVTRERGSGVRDREPEDPLHRYWRYVPGGTYRIGGWEEGEASADIDLPDYWIARYPITVAQYRQFIEAGGYDKQEYWTPNGWQWRQEEEITQPWEWDDAQYSGPNQAVIGVAWYEAAAFVRWLNAQLAEVLPAGWVAQLPTEAEWEAAVAYDGPGTQQRVYPWGENEPTPEHAIFEDDQGNNLGAPAPVGICPAGAAACGALDMVGQVWEATTSSYRGYPGASGKVVGDFKADDFDVPMRGHAYYGNRTDVRCAARSGGHPVLNRLIGYGFRPVVSPPRAN